MSDYFCEVINGEIVKYNIYRPGSFNNTSFSANASDEDYINAGLYPVVSQQIPFDPETQKQTSVFYQVSGLSVLKKNTVEPLTPEEIEARRKALIPSVVSMRQARLALLQGGLLDAVNAAIASADEAVRIEWEYATEVRRDHALVQTLSVALGLTELQLDELFTLAATL